MNQQYGSMQGQEIIEKIHADAESQAQRITENSKRIAEAENEKVRKEAEKIRQDILAGAEASAEKIRAREVSTAKIEAKRTLLKAREEAVSKIMVQIGDGLEEIRRSPERYEQSLRALAVEAVAALGREEIELKVSKVDEPFVGDTFVAAVCKRVKEISGRDVNISLKFDETDMGGGCVAYAEKGRIVFDNTFGRRLERNRPALRSAIVRELVKSDE